MSLPDKIRDFDWFGAGWAVFMVGEQARAA
jgi:hypothetical protein